MDKRVAVEVEATKPVTKDEFISVLSELAARDPVKYRELCAMAERVIDEESD